ncbi:MAG: Coenzyme F420 hydrogenase/dehydrogenase, beta subunit C-terminal domain [Promethearchaeota archaeon]|jgi:coenzyme F420 hydrogenase subunit beta
MSYELLRSEIIDAGFCQGCGLCVGSCKHLEMDEMRPTLKDFCILERDGKGCGKCYQNCPQVIQKAFEVKEPLGMFSLRSKNPDILAKASSGGFVTTLTKELLENQTLSEIVMVQKTEESLLAESVTDPDDVVNKAGAVYHRSGVLRRLVELIGETFDPVGIVGVPCEMRGAARIEESTNREILKMGLFCSSQIHPDKRCGCTLLGEAHSEAVNELKKSIMEGEIEFQEGVDLQDGKRCESCKAFCKHCQDFPAINSDITAGDVGSKNGYTTVVVWTDRGKEIVEEAIKKGLFDIGEVNEEEVKISINLKSKRELLSFEKTPRQQVLDYITEQGPSTISDIAAQTGLEPKKTRYETLRLVQLMELEMKAEPSMVEPIFSIICD